MDNTALILLLSIIVLIAVMMYLFFYQTTYNPVNPVPQNQPYPVMPQFGPYWAHGGQANSGLLY